MNFKEEIENAVNKLKSFGLDRRMIEESLELSPGYIDQQISKGGNNKLVTSLKLLSKLKALENAPHSDSKVFEMLQSINEKVSNIDLNLLKHTEYLLLVQSLCRTLVQHGAHMESLQHGADFDRVMEQLNEATATNYKTIRRITSGVVPDKKNNVA